MRGRYKYVILGAGCSGLSLCYYLLDLGVEDPILLLDRRSEFLDDRTWCFWDVEPTPFSHLALKRWYSWSLRADGGSVTQTTRRYPYLRVRSADFYEYAVRSLEAHPNVTLRMGEEVLNHSPVPGGVRVETSGEAYEADLVFDGRGLPPGSPHFEKARKEATWVPQEFLGQRVEAQRPVFDPYRCTLMDFSVDQGRGLRFVYVLPFTRETALVENVYLSEVEAGPEEHRAGIRDYLWDVYGLSGSEYEVRREEKGYIPMTSYEFPRRLGERVYSIGMLGGETRPSTGYTFLRIQRYCRRLAESLAGSPKELPEVSAKTDSRRYDLLDALFLRFMHEYPERCPEIYRQMFAGVPADSLVRFLTEKSSPLDEARLIKALPKTPFIGLAFRAALEKLREAGPPFRPGG